MPKSGRALRSPVQPRALQPYRTRRLESTLKFASDWIVCLATLTITFFVILFSVKTRHIISKTFAHKSIFNYINKLRMAEQSNYPSVSYGIPGHIWANSGTIKTGDEKEDDKDDNSSDEFKYTPNETKNERNLQDVVNNDSSYKEENFGKKTLEESKEKAPEQDKETQNVKNQSDSIKFIQQTDDKSSIIEENNKLILNNDSSNQQRPILSPSDQNPS